MYLWWSSPRVLRWAVLHWQVLTIVLGGDGFENSNKFCMVAHFYSETIFWVRDTLSSHRNGRLFCRYSIQSCRVCGELWYRTLGRFVWLFVEWANCITRAAGSRVWFVLRRLHTKASSIRQDRTVPMLAFYQRKWVSNLCLQEKTIPDIKKTL